MLWLIALALTVMAGLNAPLAACALSLAALNGVAQIRPELGWVQSPVTLAIAIGLLAAQLLADLYFVPITVKDRLYLNPQRTGNNYVHARFQSLFRPLAAAVVVAALPLPLPDWTLAVAGFSLATACYWLSAWMREYIALARGALVLLAMETLKNAALLAAAALLFWLPPLALLLLLAVLLPTVAWTLRLQREVIVDGVYGGQRAGEDS